MNFHVFKVSRGSYEGVELGGATFVLLNLPRQPWDAPVADTLFVDTTDKRRSVVIEKALQRLFLFRPAKVVRTTIRYSDSGKGQMVSIPGLLEYRVSFARDVVPQPDVSDNLYDWLSNPRQGLVESLVYSPVSNETVRYSNTNAIWADFLVQSTKTQR